MSAPIAAPSMTPAACEALPRPLAEGVQVPGTGHADDRQVEILVPDEAQQRREDLLERQVARRPEEDERIRSFGGRRRRRHACFSRWPPKPKRMADRTLSAKSDSPRDVKRA